MNAGLRHRTGFRRRTGAAAAIVALAGSGVIGCGGDSDGGVDSFLDDLEILDVTVEGMTEYNGNSSTGLAFRYFDVDPVRAEEIFAEYTDALIDSGWRPIVDDTALFSALRTVDGCDLTSVAAIERGDEIFVYVRPRTEMITSEPDPSCPIADRSR